MYIQKGTIAIHKILQLGDLKYLGNTIQLKYLPATKTCASKLANGLNQSWLNPRMDNGPAWTTPNFVIFCCKNLCINPILL